MVGLRLGSMSSEMTLYPRSRNRSPTDPVPENKSRATGRAGEFEDEARSKVGCGVKISLPDLSTLTVLVFPFVMSCMESELSKLGLEDRESEGGACGWAPPPSLAPDRLFLFEK